MNTILDITQLILGLLLIAAILLQSGGAGLGSAFGGGDAIATTRRGAEKTLFTATIVLSVLFIVLAATRIFIP